MPSSTVQTFAAPRPHNYTPDHHVGNPPHKFKNPWPSYYSGGLIAAYRTRLQTPTNFVPVPADRAGLVNVRKPEFEQVQNPAGLRATWIGHASFLIETTSTKEQKSLRILLDPVWSDRVGPYNLVGPVRFTPPPCTIEDLPWIDAVCISHDHYDHLDLPTLRQLMRKQKGDLQFFCGLGVKSVLTNLGADIMNDQVTELDWYDGVRLSNDHGSSVELVCTPAQHHSGRVPWGFHKTLWCSWVIQETFHEKKKLFFAGDTGYCHVTSDQELSHKNASHPPCPAFAHIGELYGPFDLALLPIGCFRPRSVLSGQHSSPEDSLAIHKDVRSKKSIGMHYGTLRGAFSANYEPVTEPPKLWRKGVEERGLQWGKEVGLCDIGETVMA